MSRRPMLILIALVSALLPLATALLVRGIDAGNAPLVLIGLVLGGAGLFGVLLLVRIVVVVERRRLGR